MKYRYFVSYTYTKHSLIKTFHSGWSIITADRKIDHNVLYDITNKIKAIEPTYDELCIVNYKLMKIHLFNDIHPITTIKEMLKDKLGRQALAALGIAAVFGIGWVIFCMTRAPFFFS